jgi:hypothetical protein
MALNWITIHMPIYQTVIGLLLTVSMRLLVQILPRGASISDLIYTMGIISRLQYVSQVALLTTSADQAMHSNVTISQA